MTGTVTATAGDIGGFNISSDAISDTNNNLVLSGSGKITASAGAIGGFDLTSGELRGGVENQAYVSQSIQITSVSASFSGTPSNGQTKLGSISGVETNATTFEGCLDPATIINTTANPSASQDIFIVAISEEGSYVNAFVDVATDTATSVARVAGFTGLTTNPVNFSSLTLDGATGNGVQESRIFNIITENQSLSLPLSPAAFRPASAYDSSSITNHNLTRTLTKIKLDSDNKSISINTSSFGEDGIQLEVDSNTNRPRFFAGSNTGSFFKYDGTDIAISASNFSVLDGDITANRIELAEYSKADYFVFKLITITAASSGSYFEEYITGGKTYYKLVLDGTLGGSIAQSVRINVTPEYPIGMIQPPVKLNSQGHEVTIESGISTGIGYAAKVAVSGSNVFSYGFSADNDDWFNQLFQTRVYPAGGSTTYGGGSVGDVGSSTGRVMIQNIGQRFKFVRSAFDFRLLGISSYDTTATGNFNSQGLINFHSGIRTSNGPIFIGSTSTTYGQNTKMTAGYALEVNNIVDRAGTTTNNVLFHGNVSGSVFSGSFVGDGSGLTGVSGGGGGSGDIEGVTAGNGLTGGGTSGTVTLNVGAGTGIDVAADTVSVDVSDFMANGVNNRVVTATGTDAMNAEANMTFDGTNLLVSDDSNAYANIGRTRVGYATYSDYGYVSHRDMTGAGQYALLQSSVGDTFINAATSKTLHLRINNSSIASITATGLDLAVGFTLDGNTITGVDDSGEFTNDDAHIMTSAAVEDKILGYGYTANALPLAGGTMSGAIAMGNQNITGINNLVINDPGPTEGISWNGGNTKIVECPDDLSTNSAGNLQLVYNSTRRLTVNSTGIDVNGGAVITGSLEVSGTNSRISLTNANENISMDASGNGQLHLDGSGYGFGIALGSSEVALYHNSTARNLVLGTNETARLTIAGNSGNTTCTGEFTATALFAGSGNKIGADSTDYISFTNNTRADIYINNSNEFRFESDGDFHADGDVIASSTTISDSRLKDNIIPIGGALDKIKSLRGVSYTWNSGKKKGKQDIGLIAQEVEEVLPEIVKDKKMPLMDGIDSNKTYKTIDYEKIIAVLVEAVKDQQTQIDELKRKIK
jgi:hypothetical protein